MHEPLTLPRKVTRDFDFRSVGILLHDPVVEVLMSAAAAFQGLEKSRDWLLAPTDAFDGLPPVAMMDTPEGRDKILNELGLIEHGMY